MSVDLARLTTPAESLARRLGPCFLGVLRVKDVHDLGLTVRHAPTDDNAAHSIIEGVNTRELCRKLAEKTLVL